MTDKSETGSIRDLDMEIVNEYGASTLRVGLGQGDVLLSPKEIDEIIEFLGFARVDITPPVPFEVLRNHQFPLETKATWKVITDPGFHGAVVFFRHSGYGWTGFAIPYTSLLKLLALELKTPQHFVTRTVN
ncbi:hypothetical protein [Paraburkholderia tagetis]|uniref:Uncharacterized protein n=1 Tax=Paraburkholderia tagetis TaxID=2913261 RepID=A0A9X1UCQ4_9BURK|nr:hypothetical protein [Paraburkholderia tagetis]MCG5071844.1 hypothetical protein [Paraburkholderia tagetis]